MENNEEKKVENNQVQKQVSGVSLFGIRIKWLIFGILVGIIACVILYFNIRRDMSKETKIQSTTLNIDYLTGRIRNLSDLITSELEYTGVIDYKTDDDKWYSFMTSEEFLMVYNAQVKAGIDLSKVELKESENKIEVKLPHANIKFKKVMPESIRFYDLKKAIIQGNGKEQSKEAIVDAEKDVEKNANLSLLLTNAEAQAENVIKGLIKDVINDKEVIFTYYDAGDGVVNK